MQTCMPRPKRGDIMVRQDGPYTDEAAVTTVRRNDKAPNDWTVTFYTPTEGPQGVFPQARTYTAVDWKPADWVPFKDRNGSVVGWGPKDWIPVAWTAFLTPPDKIDYSVLPSPAANEDRDLWERRMDDEAFDEMKKWDGYKKLKDRAWSQYRGIETGKVPEKK